MAQMKTCLLLSALLQSSLLVAAAPFAPVLGGPIKTTSGTVHGIAADKTSGVSAYLGIPFAQPPVGNLRWKAPVKYTGDGVINATAFPIDCAATTFSPDLATGLTSVPDSGALVLMSSLMQLGNPQSEDCLAINVWTKPTHKKKPVMLWIYGGGFAFGNSGNEVYDGQFIAQNQDVVVVSLNYRVSVFGFPGVPGVEGVEQNPGLMDQRMAVEWARDNIEQFGGDPERITIFGESAGGASVDFYTYAYTKDPIIVGAIAQSGSAASWTQPSPPANNAKWWYKASKELGCGDESAGAAATVACMRTKSTEELVAAVRVKNALQGVLGRFGPTVDGKIVYNDYAERAKAGNFIKVPYLAGSNENESGLFRLIAAADNRVVDPILWPAFTASIFTCPASWATAARAAAGLVTYRYEYFGDYMNARIIEPPNSGAYHTAEIPMIFGTTESVTNETNSEPEAKTSAFMQSMWAAFARDPMSLQKAPFNLPQYDPTKRTLIALGSNNLTHQIISPDTYDGNCGAVRSLLGSIPGGVQEALMNAAAGEELGIAGLKNSELPDLSVAYPDPPM